MASSLLSPIGGGAGVWNLPAGWRLETALLPFVYVLAALPLGVRQIALLLLTRVAVVLQSNLLWSSSLTGFGGFGIFTSFLTAHARRRDLG